MIVGAFLLMLALLALVHWTRLGKAMRAVSFDREAAAMMGIEPDRVIAATTWGGYAEEVVAEVKRTQPMPEGMDFDTAAAWIAEAGSRSISVLTGAGISTDSGIPDFRGPNGVWTRNPAAEKASNLQNYLSDPELRRRSWQHRLDSPALRAEPNDGHRALLVLEKTGRLHTLVTQNTDGLHLAAGHDPANVAPLEPLAALLLRNVKPVSLLVLNPSGVSVA